MQEVRPNCWLPFVVISKEVSNGDERVYKQHAGYPPRLSSVADRFIKSGLDYHPNFKGNYYERCQRYDRQP